MEQYFYIYNRHQSNYFIQKGLPVLEVGKGKQDGTYLKFLRDNKANSVFTEWIENKEEIMKNRK